MHNCRKNEARFFIDLNRGAHLQRLAQSCGKAFGPLERPVGRQRDRRGQHSRFGQCDLASSVIDTP